MKGRCIKLITMVLAFVVAGSTVFWLFSTDSYAASKPAQVKISSVKSTGYNSIKITWKKAKNAKKYEIYRATSKNGKYKKIKTTTATSFTNKKLIIGKKYYYKVRGVNGKLKGKFSVKKYAKPKLKTPEVDAWDTDFTTILISWKSVNGASGYQIYRSTSEDGAFKRIATVKDDESYYDKNVDAGQGYYYKVRAYKTYKGKKYYSSFSSIKYARTEINEDILTENVSLKDYKLKDGSVVIKITNDNNIMVYVNLKIVYRDSSGKLVGIDTNQVQYVSAKGVSYYISYDMEGEKYAKYELSHEAFEQSGVEDHIKDLEIESNLVDDELMLGITNKSKRTLEYVSVILICYDKNNNIIGYSQGSQIENLKPGKTDYLELYTDEGYDHYEIVPIYAVYYTY